MKILLKKQLTKTDFRLYPIRDLILISGTVNLEIGKTLNELKDCGCSNDELYDYGEEFIYETIKEIQSNFSKYTSSEKFIILNVYFRNFFNNKLKYFTSYSPSIESVI